MKLKLLFVIAIVLVCSIVFSGVVYKHNYNSIICQKEILLNQKQNISDQCAQLKEEVTNLNTQVNDLKKSR